MPAEAGGAKSPHASHGGKAAMPVNNVGLRRSQSHSSLILSLKAEAAARRAQQNPQAASKVSKRILPLYRFTILTMGGVPINVGWAVGEALIVPYLLRLNIPAGIASLVFLIDPVFGIFAQPVAGVLSDRCTMHIGKRRPFILAFTIAVCVGFVIVMTGVDLANLIVPTGPPMALIIAILFFGYGLLDLGSDLLVTPSRALLFDTCHSSQINRGCGWFSSFASLGRFVGLAVASIQVQEYPPFSLLGLDHIRTTFALAVATHIIVNGIICVFGKEKDPNAENDRIKALAAASEAREAARKAASAAFDVAIGATPVIVQDVEPGQEFGSRQSQGRDRGYSWFSAGSRVSQGRDRGNSAGSALLATEQPCMYGTGGARVLLDDDIISEGENEDEDDEDEDDEVDLTVKESIVALCNMEREMAMVWLMQTSAWLTSLVQCFFWTSWVAIDCFHAAPGSAEFDEGVSFGTLALCLQSLLAVVLAYMLPAANRKIGTRVVFYGTIGFNIVVMLGVILQPIQSKWGSMGLALATAPLQAVISASGYILVEEIVEAKDRAISLALLNLCMVVAQIITAVGCGLVLMATGSMTWTMFTFSVAALVLWMFVTFDSILSYCRRIRRSKRKREKKRGSGDSVSTSVTADGTKHALLGTV